MFLSHVQNRRIAPWLGCFLLGVSGCASPPPMAIQVCDAETMQPIPGAEVRVWYPNDPPTQTRKNSIGMTQADGIARIMLSTDPHECPLVELSAPGHIWVERPLPYGGAYASSSTAKGAASGPDRVLEMYADPRPSVELVVPNGYRGLIEVKVQVQDNAAAVPGQRAFRAVVTPMGTAEVTGPPVLRYLIGEGFQAKYADGREIKRQVADPIEVGFWWLSGEETSQLFLVGTRDEYEAHKRSMMDDSGKPRSGGKGGGRGGHGGGHRGGSPDGSGSSSAGASGTSSN